jgi:carbonic anhydrase/acetyltransferase-like protein (isoleucine patch superfamily)
MSTSRHGGGRILALGDRVPRLAPDAFVAPGGFVIGDVTMGEGASLWFNCVARGDVEAIRIGARSNVQDGSILHADPGFPTLIGMDVAIGHGAIVHGCRIEDGAFVGMGAVLMNGAVVETRAMLAAGALLSAGKCVPTGELWAGRPAKFMRPLGPDDFATMRDNPLRYRENARRFRAESIRWIVPATP